MDQGMCPMHCWLLHMFGNFRDVGHYVKMDNLFMSVNFAREAYALPTRVLIHGVICKSKRGVPECVLQEEKKGKAADRARGTVKAAVLKNDGKSNNLIVASCYDQKPFYMLSHSISEITWVEREKRAYSHLLNMVVAFKFLHFNLSDDYNFEMNDNDVADQLRLVYQLMRFQRNMKWWWALWLWGIEDSVVNLYMMYQHYHEFCELEMKYDHYSFQEACGYAYIDPTSMWPTRQATTARKTPPSQEDNLHSSKRQKSHTPEESA